MKLSIKYIIFIVILLQGCILVGYTLFYQSGYSDTKSFVKKIDLIKQAKALRKTNNEDTFEKESNKTDGGIQADNELCEGIKFDSRLIDEKSWFPVDEGRTMFVFSAFYIKERRNIYIIGAKHIVTSNPICQYWYPGGNSRVVLFKENRAISKMPREGESKKFTATIFECGIDTSAVPSYISLVTKSCTTPLNMLRVKDVSKPEKYKNSFVVCLSPLYYNYSRAYELVEWIELNRILGAEKFLIYNITTSINIDQVLEYYSKRGLAEVVQWRLPMRISTYPQSKEPTEIHYFGQTAALNDCLFRSKGDSEYLVNVDLDEFIIPHGKNMSNWTDTIKQFEGKFDAFLFQSTYFRKEWENNITDLPNKDQVEKFKLITLQIYEHEGRIFAPRHRSKYIAQTATVDRILIHEVPASKTKIIPIGIALVHHYRNWFNLKDRKGEVRDITVQQKFGINLINNVQKVWNDLPEVKLEIPRTV